MLPLLAVPLISIPSSFCPSLRHKPTPVLTSSQSPLWHSTSAPKVFASGVCSHPLQYDAHIWLAPPAFLRVYRVSALRLAPAVSVDPRAALLIEFYFTRIHRKHRNSGADVIFTCPTHVSLLSALILICLLFHGNSWLIPNSHAGLLRSRHPGLHYSRLFLRVPG
ncbi:hypothetical protein B0H14DRAFT_2748779 [Mycena olivaceomarginata]|nr:hypothetical protein B0H14DRAFT_2797141 [Mycena olivaceomarginata]KAJ7858505.1 hypothetical protein B0H14DRAFT_2748779 [Mycena olivaceomarginata]